eukprot:1593052-Heterocapsa_arctica.AAC.1
MRLSRKEAIRFLKGQEKFGNYYTLMAQTTDGKGAKQLGYIMFEDLLNKVYALFLDQFITDSRVKWLSTGIKGDIVKSIMALGFFWQNTGATNKELEGILELVNCMENEMRTGQRSIATQEDEEELESQLPVNRKEFKLAIQLLQELINGLSEQIIKDG